MRKTRHANLELLFVLAAAVFSFALNPTLASANTKIEVHNCSNSKHEVKVYAANEGANITNAQKVNIHSGDTKQVHCSTNKCNMWFQSGDKNKNRTAGDPNQYVYVHDDHKMNVAADSSACNN